MLDNYLIVLEAAKDAYEGSKKISANKILYKGQLSMLYSLLVIDDNLTSDVKELLLAFIESEESTL